MNNKSLSVDLRTNLYKVKIRGIQIDLKVIDSEMNELLKTKYKECFFTKDEIKEVMEKAYLQFDVDKNLNNLDCIADEVSNKTNQNKDDVKIQNHEEKKCIFLTEEKFILYFRNKEILNKLSKLLIEFKKFFPEKTIEEILCLILNEAHEHFMNYYLMERFKEINEKGELILLDVSIDDNTQNSLRLEEAPKYKFFPSEIKTIYQQEKSKIEFKTLFSLSFMKYFSKCLNPFKEIEFQEEKINFPENDKTNQYLILNQGYVRRRFLNFLIYFGNLFLLKNRKIKEIKHGIPLIHIRHKDITSLAYNLRNNENGVENLSAKLEKEMIAFINPLFNRPKGIIFDGPPRSGKTYTTTKIIKYLNLYQIHRSLVAGDFMQSLQGQSEKMIDSISNRCDVLPWELCVMYIDEVDSLAPNRNKENSSNSQNSIIGQFLAITDGNKKKHNLLLIATTNRLAAMDPAFVQRFDLKIFLGVPNYKARINWIDSFINDYSEKTQKKDLLIIKDPILPFRNMILNMTLNFTADAMRNVLSKIIIVIEVTYGNLKDITKKENFGSVKNLIFSVIRDTCKNDIIYFGKFILPDLVKDMEVNLENEYVEMKEVFQIFDEKERSKINFSPTRRILIDLKEKENNQVFQLEKINNKVLDNEKKQILVESILLMKDIDSNTFKFKLNDLKSEFKDESCIKSLLKKKRFDKSYSNNEIESALKNLKKKSLLINQLVQLIINFKKDFPEIEKYLALFSEKSSLEKLHHYFDIFVNLIKTQSSKNTFLNCYGPTIGLTNKEEVLKILLYLAIKDNLDYVLLIDMDYFFKKTIITDEKIAEEVNYLVEECNKYEKSMLIFDLDSICGIQYEYSNLKQELIYSLPLAYEADESEASFTYRYSHPKTFEICLQHFESAKAGHTNNWYVAISSHNKITLDFKDKLKWPLNNYGKQIEDNIKENLVEKICLYCKEQYTEKNNKNGSCSRHIKNLFYLESDLQSKIEKYNFDKNRHFDKIRERLNFSASTYENSSDNDFSRYFKENTYPQPFMCDIYTREEVEEMIENNTIQYLHVKYLCCSKNMYEKGEIPDFHVEH